MGLRDYKAKRDFRKTREPAGRLGSARKPKQPIFVVQKHDATRLHYDFRLEMEGVLKSWAVPRGFPTKRGDRRLAVQVEDHPIDYADFEGTIAEGNYGAGTVMLWDTGIYATGGGDPLRELESGKLHLFLRGKKLKSEWTLVRLKIREENEKPQWLLLKSREDVRVFSPRQNDRSVLTGRSMNQIASENDRQWASNHAAGPRSKRIQSAARNRTSERRTSEPATARRAKGGSGDFQKPATFEHAARRDVPRSRKPGSARFIEPMKACPLARLPQGNDWLYEVKFDGVRALGIKQGNKVQLVSRSAKDLARKYSPITQALRALPASQAVVDGEIVALDASGRSSFQLLQTYQMPTGRRPPLVYYVFDLLHLDRKDLTGLPLEQRKQLAQFLLTKVPEPIRFSPGIKAEPKKLIREMQARGLEGLIAKRRDSKYEPGRRSGAWVKFKWTDEQEFVIGGYTPPKGTRSHFGALLVGYYEAGNLMFAAKCGTGFDQKLLASLHGRFQRLIQKDCPFVNLPERLSSGGSYGLTAREMRTCTWLEPSLVCQVRFAEWTRDGHLRQPAFFGLREDKAPEEVVREKPQG
jgi:bifunctional non-homologous end joining protein LigD